MKNKNENDSSISRHRLRDSREELIEIDLSKFHEMVIELVIELIYVVIVDDEDDFYGRDLDLDLNMN